MARQTKADRILEHEKTEALRLRDEVASMRRMPVIALMQDVFSAPLLSDDMRASLYTSLSAVQYLRDEVARRLKWAADGVADATRNFERNRIYSSVPVQNIDDLNHAHGRYHAALEGARMLFAAAGVHCDRLYEDTVLARRQRTLEFDVRRTDCGTFVVERNGERVPDTGNEQTGEFSEEWLAWRAVSALIGRS